MLMLRPRGYNLSAELLTAEGLETALNRLNKSFRTITVMDVSEVL